MYRTALPRRSLFHENSLGRSPRRAPSNARDPRAGRPRAALPLLIGRRTCRAAACLAPPRRWFCVCDAEWHATRSVSRGVRLIVLVIDHLHSHDRVKVRAVGLEVLHLTVRHRERVILVVNGARRSHGSGAVILRARLSARSAALKIWPMALTFASRAHPRRPPTMRSLDPR